MNSLQILHRLLMRARLWGVVSLVLVCSFAEAAAGDGVSLRLSGERVQELVFSEVDAGVFEVRTTGGDPFLYTEGIPAGVDFSTHHILAFEYFSLTGTGEVQVFLEPEVREEISVHGEVLGRSEGWSGYSVDLAPALAKVSVPATGLRIDFGRHAGRTVQIRKLVLRGKTDVERAYEARKALEKERAIEGDRVLRAYLDADFKSSISSVSIASSHISVKGHIENQGYGLVLVEIPVYTDLSNSQDFRVVQRLDGISSFSGVIPRVSSRVQLFSRWAIARPEGFGYELVSHVRYADSVESKWDLEEEKPWNRKGLGAFHPSRPVEDVKDLGVSAVTVNVLLNRFLRAEAGEGRSAYAYGGRTWYTDDAAVARLDALLRDASELNQIVSAILLIPQAGNSGEGSVHRLMAHPGADPAGIYVMPDVTSEEGMDAYTATLNFLAERYSRPDKKYGRIHHWIMHNEVNSGWVWTNMGEATALRYMDAYHKSMRVMHLIARSYNPHARVYISLEHNWTTKHNDKCHTGREMLELLEDFSRVEGDFEWALAYHPYPENLGNPRTWEDTLAEFNFDTPQITFKNIEVIDAWMKRDEALYLGEHVRDIQFTEQGPNSPDYSEESLRDQAAAMAYVWKKMAGLESVTMFHFHNWVDNRHEGGLRIGLRKYPDDADDPHGKKPVWYVFQALGTEGEDVAVEFAKGVIGIGDWGEILSTDFTDGHR